MVSIFRLNELMFVLAVRGKFAATMNLCVIVVLYCCILESSSANFTDSFSHFNISDESEAEDFSAQIHVQAISSVMAAAASRMINQDWKTQGGTVEPCTQHAQDLLEYAQCLEPLWNGKEQHIRTKKSIRTFEMAQWQQIDDQNRISMKKAASAGPMAKSPIGHMADFLTSFFVKPAPENMKEPIKKFADSDIMSGTLIESFVNELFKPIGGLIDAFRDDVDGKEDKIAKFLDKMRNGENFKQMLAARPTGQLELLKGIQQLVSNFTHASANDKEDQNSYVLSPRFFPISPPEKGRRFLSPDIFSFDHQPEKNRSVDNIAPMDELLGGEMVEGDRRSLKKFIMQLSGAEEKFKEKKKKMMRRPIRKNEKIDKMEKVFRRLYKSVQVRQLDELEQRGYAFLTKRQMQMFYGGKGAVPGSRYENSSLLHELYGTTDKHDLLRQYFRNVANEQGSRSKRAVVGNASVLAPFILAPQAANPIILHPLVLSPLVLSPSVLGPLILSPALFSPIILSPSVLGGAVLTPLVGDVLVLSPLVLFPIILSPLVLNPLILSPIVLAPIVLSPLLLSPVILTPLVLSPVVLSPVVLSPLVLSPGVLSPLVHSPVVSGMKMLSPELMSPSINSPKSNYTVVMSPSLLSKK